MKNTDKLSKSDNITPSKKDLVEISLNLTQAAKIVEKTNPKLADWLKFVNRKAIALVNKEK
jgi:hypothetical protein